MLSTAFALNVHLTGGPAWWADLIGPFLLSITAIAAAAIAAHTANKRQAQQLAYDRDQRNRQHVRDTVDDAVRQWDEAIRAIAKLNGRVVKKPIAADEVAALRLETYDFGTDLISMNLRLSLRLGEHPIVTAHKRFSGAYGNRQKVLAAVDTSKPMSDAIKESLDEAAGASTDAASDFLGECEEWFQDG